MYYLPSWLLPRGVATAHHEGSGNTSAANIIKAIIKIIIKKLATTYSLIKHHIKQETALKKTSSPYYTRTEPVYLNTSFHTYLCGEVISWETLPVYFPSSRLSRNFQTWNHHGSFSDKKLHDAFLTATTFCLSAALQWWLERTFSPRGSLWLTRDG